MRYLEEKVGKSVYLSKYCDKPNVINGNVYVLRMIYEPFHVCQELTCSIAILRFRSF